MIQGCFFSSEIKWSRNGPRSSACPLSARKTKTSCRAWENSLLYSLSPATDSKLPGKRSKTSESRLWRFRMIKKPHPKINATATMSAFLRGGMGSAKKFVREPIHLHLLGGGRGFYRGGANFIRDVKLTDMSW